MVSRLNDRLQIAELSRAKREIFEKLRNYLKYLAPSSDEPDLGLINRIFLTDELKENVKKSILALREISSSLGVETLSALVDIEEKMSLLNSGGESSLNILSELHSAFGRYQNSVEQTIEQLKRDYKQKLVRDVYGLKSVGGERNIVYHAVKLEFVPQILSERKILGYSYQRYWEDGKRRKDDDPAYDESFYMKGISTTRSLEYAVNWGSVVFILDLDEIKNQKKVVTFAWNFQFGSSASTNRVNPKKEMEEFIVFSKSDRMFTNEENEEWKKELEEILSLDPDLQDDPEYFKEYVKKLIKKRTELCVSDLKQPSGELKLGKALLGVLLVGDTVDIFGPENSQIKHVLSDEKFLGIIDRD